MQTRSHCCLLWSELDWLHWKSWNGLERLTHMNSHPFLARSLLFSVDCWQPLHENYLHSKKPCMMVIAQLDSTTYFHLGTQSGSSPFWESALSPVKVSRLHSYHSHREEWSSFHWLFSTPVYQTRTQCCFQPSLTSSHSSVLSQCLPGKLIPSFDSH